jgi:hypothetical protein
VGIVRGDRIGESERLNRCSLETQTFYALFVGVVPDDFGRFRLSPGHIALRMFPRREPTGRVLRKVKQHLAEMESQELLRTWDADGQAFAELTGFHATGNIWHRTPEPPWSTHRHGNACVHSAMARAREWGDRTEVENLSNQIKEIRERSRSGAVAKPQRSALPSSPSSPPLLHTDIQRADAGAGAREAEDQVQEERPLPPAQVVPMVRPDQPANPLVAGRRADLESELLGLIRQIGPLTGKDPEDVLAYVSSGGGKFAAKVNPLTLSDDRLLHTVQDARQFLRELQAGDEPDSPPADGPASGPPPKTDPGAASAWERVLPELERLLTPHAYATWFRVTYGWRFDAGGALVVAVPVKHAEEWIPNAFGAQIDEALKAAGLPARPVRFECSNPPARASPPPKAAAGAGGRRLRI